MPIDKGVTFRRELIMRKGPFAKKALEKIYINNNNKKKTRKRRLKIFMHVSGGAPKAPPPPPSRAGSATACPIIYFVLHVSPFSKSTSEYEVWLCEIKPFYIYAGEKSTACSLNWRSPKAQQRMRFGCWFQSFNWYNITKYSNKIILSCAWM